MSARGNLAYFVGIHFPGGVQISLSVFLFFSCFLFCFVLFFREREREMIKANIKVS